MAQITEAQEIENAVIDDVTRFPGDRALFPSKFIASVLELALGVNG